MKRRTFLGGAAAGLTVLFTTACSLPPFPKRPAPDLEDAQGWIRFDKGRYRLYLPRAEMGQNIATGLRQIACEELGIDAAAITVVLPSTAMIRRVRGTVGSESIQVFALPLAQACATLRQALERGESGMLHAEAIPREKLRSFSSSTTHVGKSARLTHGREILTGKALYAGDVRRPNQLYGRVLRAPVSPEISSRLLALDEVAARAVPGFVRLVRSSALLMGASEGVGIVARTPGALDRIADALAPRWETGKRPDTGEVAGLIDIDGHLQRGALRHRLRNDDLDLSTAWTVDLRFDVPAAAHAPIEPRCAVAEYLDGRMQMWVGSQDAFYQRDVVTKRLGLSEEKVVVYPMRIGGAFGSRTISTVELEAAVLAHAVEGAVKVQWTRAQEFTQSFHRPPSSHRIRARVQDGRVTEWWHAFVSSHILFTSAGIPAWLQGMLDFVGDDGVARGAALAYAVPRQRIEHDAIRLPFFTGPWRGLGAGPNLLAIESAMDECAHVSGIDPLAFRIGNMTEPRLRRVLQRVATVSGWGKPPRHDAQWTVGRGMACGIYKGASYAAAVAEVAVERTTGKVHVTRFWCAHDCGQVINPDQVRAQIEGNLVWSIGMVLIEELPFAEGAVTAATFLDSPIPRMADVPPLEVHLIDDGDAPSGAGESAIVAGAGAIANALRAATGTRFQRFPIGAAEVLAVLGRQRRTA